MHHTTERRIERAIISLARKRGYDGDPFAEVWSGPDALDDVLAVAAITIDIRPLPRTGSEKQLAQRIARSIVATSTWPIRLPAVTSGLPNRKRGRR